VALHLKSILHLKSFFLGTLGAKPVECWERKQEQRDAQSEEGAGGDRNTTDYPTQHDALAISDPLLQRR